MLCKLLSRVHNHVNWFHNHVDKQFAAHPWAQKVFLGIGTYYVLRQVLSHVPARLYKFNMISRYGEGSWAVVTGASDGIGRAFCFELAQHGFNIVLISRTVSKMDDICKELQGRFKVQTKIIEADFKQGMDVKFYERIAAEVQGLDVSILVNNVGQDHLGIEYENLDDQEILDTLTVNAASTMFTTRALINQLLNRNHRSAVITISSVLGSVILPYKSVYSGTKAFQDYFMQSLIVEYGHKIDFLSVAPAGVQTNMMPVVGKFGIQAHECARSAIDELRWGKTFTFGHKKHKKFAASRLGFACASSQIKSRLDDGKYVYKYRERVAGIKNEEQKSQN